MKTYAVHGFANLSWPISGLDERRDREDREIATNGGFGMAEFKEVFSNTGKVLLSLVIISAVLGVGFMIICGIALATGSH